MYRVSERGRAFVLPLLTLSVTFVVLLAANAIVLVMRSRAAAVARPDPCLLGRWRVTDHRESTVIGGLGELRFVSSGAVATYRRDGTATTDFGTGTAFTTSAGGRRIEVQVRGTVHYRFTARDGELAVSDVHSDATYRTYIDGRSQAAAARYVARAGTASYECSATTLVQRADSYTTIYVRAD